ncbi:MAG: hypothetical protein AB9M60_17820 [Leptothrix sp. (in: b-proteobacteria)]
MTTFALPSPFKLNLRVLGAVALLVAGTAQAADLNSVGQIGQANFKALSQDLGAAVAYKGLVPAETLGLVGFDVGVGLTATQVENSTALRAAAGGASVPASLPLASVRAVKGLPFNIDVGVALGKVPLSNVRTVGGEIRWAVIEGGIAMPAVAVRAAVNRLGGVDHLKVNTTTFDVSISKGFLMLTPYAGVGTVLVRSSAPGTSLASESFSKGKVFAGLNVNLGLVNLAAETDKTGNNTSYGLKAGLRF